MRFSGTITALITPFKEGKVDVEGLRENIRFQINEGIDGLLVLGTTGEGGVLTLDEQEKVISIAAEKKRVPLMVSTGDNSTMRAVEKTKQAEKLGADGILSVTPYYNRPTQEGLYRHFEAIAKGTSLPIILYHHPKRTGVEFSLETLSRLSKIPNIVGIKDASGSIPFAASVISRLPNFVFLAGDDVMTLPLLAIGGQGVISILSNLFPKKMGEMVRKKDQKLFLKLLPFMEHCVCETNPIPIKAMMKLMGKAAGECRMPLSPLSKENAVKVKALMNG